MTTSIVNVVVEDTASEQDLDSLRPAFAALGYDGEIEATYARRSVDVLPWLVSVTLLVPLGAFITSFAKTFGEELAKEAAKDAYPGFKQWVISIFRARADTPARRSGVVELLGSDDRRLVLDSDLPEDAFVELARIDWVRLDATYIVWDEELKTWRDPLSR